MGSSNSVPEEIQGHYREVVKQTNENVTNEFKYDLQLKASQFELVISHDISTRREGGGSFKMDGMSLLLGEPTIEGDKSKGEEVFVNFKTKNASTAKGHDDSNPFGVPLPDADAVVDFKMKVNQNGTLSFVTFPKMRFDPLTGVLARIGKAKDKL